MALLTMLSLRPILSSSVRLVTKSIRLSSNIEITNDEPIYMENPFKNSDRKEVAVDTDTESLFKKVTTVNTSPVNDEPIVLNNPFKKDTQMCILCRLKITPNYKNYRLLSQFQSPYTGRIYGRHITGLCKAQQALVESEITKAQNCAFMPYYYKDKAFLKDPKLFDPDNPLRPHRY